MTILFNTNEMHKAVAEAIQEMWKNNLGVVRIAHESGIEGIHGFPGPRDYQVARASWIADYADPMTFLDVFADEEKRRSVPQSGL